MADVDSHIATVRTKLPELDTALKVAETRVTELERKATNADRLTRVRASASLAPGSAESRASLGRRGRDSARSVLVPLCLTRRSCRT